jgi:Cdc6-like AAA superfamily ATPase
LRTYYELPSFHVAHFVGREDILENIDSTFSDTLSTSLRPKVLVLHALGGQGKSQLALEYCRRSKEIGKYRGIFWINASSATTASQGFETIAAKINSSLKKVLPDTDSKIAFVKENLEGWKEWWLLVFDNYDQPNIFKNIKSLIPAGKRTT